MSSVAADSKIALGPMLMALLASMIMIAAPERAHQANLRLGFASLRPVILHPLSPRASRRVVPVRNLLASRRVNPVFGHLSRLNRQANPVNRQAILTSPLASRLAGRRANPARNHLAGRRANQVHSRQANPRCNPPNRSHPPGSILATTKPVLTNSTTKLPSAAINQSSRLTRLHFSSRKGCVPRSLEFLTRLPSNSPPSLAI